MSKMSNYLENLLLNRVLRGQSFTPPATVYLALFTGITAGGDGDPTSQTEVTGGSYARQAVTFSSPSSGSTANSSTVAFPTASADWGTVTHWGIFDASTSGNLLYWGDNTDISVLNGENFSVAAGGLTVSISGNLSASAANSLLNATLRNTALAAPTIYVALLTAFTNDATYTECSDSNYSRQTAAFSSPSNGATENSADIVYPAMAGSQTITHAALFDASSGGNMLWRGALNASKTVGAGKVLKILAGDLDIALA